MDDGFVHPHHSCVQEGAIREIREAISDLREVVVTLERVVGAPPDFDSPGTGMYKVLFEARGGLKGKSIPAPSIRPDPLARTLMRLQVALAVIGALTFLGAAAKGAWWMVWWASQNPPPAQVAPAAAPPRHS